MSDLRYTFGPVTRLEAEAIGKPGERRFRILVSDETHDASVWLEKEQLQALAIAIDSLLGELKLSRSLGRAVEEAPPTPGPFPENPAIDFTVGRLGLGYDEEQGLFIMVAHDTEGDADGPPTFSCRATRAQLEAFSKQAAAVCAAGRPRCPLCGTPTTGELHFCPESNGHAHTDSL